MEIINPLEYPEWDKLLLTAPGPSFFHTSFWARVLHDSYGYRPCYLARIHDGKLKTLLPLMEVSSFLTGRRGVSLPFTDYCEPILSDQNDPRDMQEFLKDYGAANKWRYYELRGGEESLGAATHYSAYYRHDLKLSPDVDALYARLKSSRRRNIRKALREGVAINRSNSLDAVKAFYQLHCLTRKKHGLPPQPFRFFKQIYDHVISRGHGQVILATNQGRTIAGAIFFHFGDEAIYKFGASHCKCLHLRPNDLVMWEAIQWYCRNDYKKFCFGRTTTDNDGLRQYKKGWGTEEKLICYTKYDLKKQQFVQSPGVNFALRNAVFNRMPSTLAKVVGDVFYRHIG